MFEQFGVSWHLTLTIAERLPIFPIVRRMLALTKALIYYPTPKRHA